jgi:3-methyladenine DNA glycosylase AlkD
VPDVAGWVDDLDAQLRTAGTPERAIKERAYLKSTIDHYGVSVPACRAIAASFARAHRDLAHDELCAVAEALWSVPVFERRRLAVELLERFVAQLTADDVPMLEEFLRQSGTWALVDEIAPSVVGPLVVEHPELGHVLDRWAVDEDFWIRRAAMLALLVPLRRGGGDFERFTRYADAQLEDTQFFIRKAIGWILRDTAKRRPDLVFEWLLPRASRASGVTIREAVKPLSSTQRSEILAAR